MISDPVNAETDYAVWPGEYFLEWLDDNSFVITSPEVVDTLDWGIQKIASFLAGSIHLTEEMATGLEALTTGHSTTKITANTWMRFERQYRADLRRLESAAGRFSGPEPELAIAIALKGTGYRSHVYDGGRCLFCGVNDLDEMLYGDADLLLPEDQQEYRCVDRGQYHYSTNSAPAKEQSGDDKTKNGAAHG